MKRTSSLLILLLISLSIFSQRNNPISVETMVGDRLSFNVTATKHFSPKLTFKSVNAFLTEYDYKKNKNGTEIVANNSLIYNFTRNVGVGVNMQYHFFKGFVPALATQFAYGNPNFLLVLAPNLNFMPWLGTDIVAIAQYRPKLNNNFRLFSEAKAMYSHNLEDNVHERSYYNLRLGTTYRNFVTFGAGYNFDFYGKDKFQKDDNYGVFVKFYL